MWTKYKVQKIEVAKGKRHWERQAGRQPDRDRQTDKRSEEEKGEGGSGACSMLAFKMPLSTIVPEKPSPENSEDAEGRSGWLDGWLAEYMGF